MLHSLPFPAAVPAAHPFLSAAGAAATTYGAGAKRLDTKAVTAGAGLENRADYTDVMIAIVSDEIDAGFAVAVTGTRGCFLLDGRSDAGSTRPAREIRLLLLSVSLRFFGCFCWEEGSFVDLSGLILQFF